MARGDLTHTLDALFDGLIARKDIHSAVMSVVSGDGTFQWTGARGTTAPGGAPMLPTTPWFIASITKLFIASVVMRMVEEGELSLADRLVDRLPDSVTNRLHVLKSEDRTSRITIEHLLSHTSGLADYIEDYPVPRGVKGGDRRSLVELLVAEGDRDWSLQDTVLWVRERLTPHFAPQPLDAQRVRIRYSDTNYQLLIGIIEARRNAPFFQVMTDLILTPLELDHTWLSGHSRTSGPEPEVAALYAGAEVAHFPRFLASITDMHSTCEDLSQFLKAVVAGRLFRDPGTWPRMQTRWSRFGFPFDRAALRQPSWPIEYGLGVMRFQLPRFLTPIRAVPHVVGHTGSTGTWLFHAPEPDLYLVGSVNQITAGAVPFKVVPKILRAVDGRRVT